MKRVKVTCPECGDFVIYDLDEFGVRPGEQFEVGVIRFYSFPQFYCAKDFNRCTCTIIEEVTETPPPPKTITNIVKEIK
jgi:hypothetical protein